MLKPSLSTRTTKGLTIIPQFTEENGTICFSGTCDSATLSLLEDFLGELHAEMVRLRRTEVAIDCENLFFMNSSSLKCFVSWLAKVKALPTLSRYHVNVRTNPKLPWQQRSFSALSRFAPGTLIVDA